MIILLTSKTLLEIIICFKSGCSSLLIDLFASLPIFFHSSISSMLKAAATVLLLVVSVTVAPTPDE